MTFYPFHGSAQAPFSRKVVVQVGCSGCVSKLRTPFLDSVQTKGKTTRRNWSSIPEAPICEGHPPLYTQQSLGDSKSEIETVALYPIAWLTVSLLRHFRNAMHFSEGDVKAKLMGPLHRLGKRPAFSGRRRPSTGSCKSARMAGCGSSTLRRGRW